MDCLSLLQARWNFTGGVFTQRKAKAYNCFGDCSIKEYFHCVYPKYLVEIYRYTSINNGGEYDPEYTLLISYINTGIYYVEVQRYLTLNY